MASCPQHILIPRHFRGDGTCRCDDPNHHEMEGWGYEWNGKRWIVPEDAWEDCGALGRKRASSRSAKVGRSKRDL